MTSVLPVKVDRSIRSSRPCLRVRRCGQDGGHCVPRQEHTLNVLSPASGHQPLILYGDAMSEQMDLELGIELRREGMYRTARGQRLLKLVREAVKLAAMRRRHDFREDDNRRGTATVDDAYCAMRWYDIPDKALGCSYAGQIFRDRQWVKIGDRPSRRKSNRGRRISVWCLKT